MIKEPKSPYNDRCKPSVPLLLLSPFSCLFPKSTLFFTFVLSNNAKNYQLSQTFLSKHLEGVKKHRTFAPAFPNKACAEKGRAIKISDL